MSLTKTTPLSLFTCPSDPTYVPLNSLGYACGSYTASTLAYTGTSQIPRTFTDGTSNTVFIAEQLSQCTATAAVTYFNNWAESIGTTAFTLLSDAENAPAGAGGGIMVLNAGTYAGVSLASSQTAQISDGAAVTLTSSLSLAAGDTLQYAGTNAASPRYFSP